MLKQGLRLGPQLLLATLRITVSSWFPQQLLKDKTHSPWTPAWPGFPQKRPLSCSVTRRHMVLTHRVPSLSGPRVHLPPLQPFLGLAAIPRFNREPSSSSVPTRYQLSRMVGPLSAAPPSVSHLHWLQKAADIFYKLKQQFNSP